MGVLIDNSVIMAAQERLLCIDIPNSNRQVYISVITIAELLLAVQKAIDIEQQSRRSAFVEHLIASFDSLPFDKESAKVYASIARNSHEKNINLSVHDMLVASTAIVHGYPLLTLNEKNLQNIPGLQILNA